MSQQNLSHRGSSDSRFYNFLNDPSPCLRNKISRADLRRKRSRLVLGVVEAGRGTKKTRRTAVSNQSKTLSRYSERR